MINISNEREKQQQTAVFSFGKRRKRYEEKSFERIIVRSNDTWGSSRMWKLLGYRCRLPRLLTQQGLTTIERVNNAG